MVWSEGHTLNQQSFSLFTLKKWMRIISAVTFIWTQSWRKASHLNIVKLVKATKNTAIIPSTNIIQFLIEITIISALFLLLRSHVEFWLFKNLPHFRKKSMGEWDGGNGIIFNGQIKWLLQSEQRLSLMIWCELPLDYYYLSLPLISVPLSWLQGKSSHKRKRSNSAYRMKC